MKWRSFTIIELTVVGFIVLLLAGGLSYIIIGALSHARTVECANNLKMQGMAMLQAVQASPITGIPGLKGYNLPKAQDSAGKNWVEVLQELGGATEGTFRCTGALNAEDPSYGLNPLAGAKWDYPRQMLYGGFILLPGETRPCNKELIKHPERTLIVSDAATVDASADTAPPEVWREIEAPWLPYVALPLIDTISNTYGNRFDFGYDWGNTAPGNSRGALKWEQYRRPIGRHSTRCNALFLDGHAATLEIHKIIAPQWGSADSIIGNQ